MVKLCQIWAHWCRTIILCIFAFFSTFMLMLHFPCVASKAIFIQKLSSPLTLPSACLFLLIIYVLILVHPFFRFSFYLSNLLWSIFRIFSDQSSLNSGAVMNKSFKPLIGVFQIDQVYKRAKNIFRIGHLLLTNFNGRPPDSLTVSISENLRPGFSWIENSSIPLSGKMEVL